MKASKAPLTLKDAQKRVDQWIRDIGRGYFDELTNLALLSEEVGELARTMARRYGAQTWKPGEQPSSPAEELADVLWVLMCLANQMGIDMETAFEQTMHKKTHRDHVRYQGSKKT